MLLDLVDHAPEPQIPVCAHRMAEFSGDGLAGAVQRIIERVADNEQACEVCDPERDTRRAGASMLTIDARSLPSPFPLCLARRENASSRVAKLAPPRAAGFLVL
jgi:hypothetical protein